MAKYLDENGVSKLWTKIKNLLNGKANTNHTHSASQVSGLASVATSGSYNDLSNKPTIPTAVTVDSALSSTSTNPVQNKVINSALSGKADTGHKHMMNTISGLESALGQKANTNHTHTIANITNLQSSLDGKLNVQDPSFNGTIYGAKWSGQTGTSSDNHAIIIGANQKDYCDFLEYGAVWNFYKSIEGTKTLVAKIQEDGIYHNNTKLSLEGHKHKVSDVEGLAYDLQVRPTRDDFYSDSGNASDEDYLTKQGVKMCVLTELAGQKSGVASLDANGKVPASQLPTSSGGSASLYRLNVMLANIRNLSGSGGVSLQLSFSFYSKVLLTTLDSTAENPTDTTNLSLLYKILTELVSKNWQFNERYPQSASGTYNGHPILGVSFIANQNVLRIAYKEDMTSTPNWYDLNLQSNEYFLHVNLVQIM